MNPEDAFRHHKIREWEVQEKERQEREPMGKETKNADREVRGSNIDSNGNGVSSRRSSFQR